MCPEGARVLGAGGLSEELTPAYLGVGSAVKQGLWGAEWGL